MADKWTKVEMQATFPTWDRDNEKEIEGVLTEKRENIGPNASKGYIIEIGNDESKMVWGTSQLDRALQQVEIGEKIKIVYLGKKKGNKGNSYHAFEVYRG